MAPGVMWTKEDCDKLNQLVERHGKKWTPIASFLGAGKTGKQCRRQWERLNIMTKQSGWTPEEDEMLLEYQCRYGNKWTRISRLIGGRTDNAVKNRYHALRLKHKAAVKYLPRIDSCSLSGDKMLGKRALRNCSSLEERRAAKEEAERYKSGDGQDGVFFKSEPLGKTGFYPPNFEGGWNANRFLTTESCWMMDGCKPPASSMMIPYCHDMYTPVPDAVMGDGQCGPFLMNVSAELSHPMTTPSLVSTTSNRMTDDADSEESSSESKIVAAASTAGSGLPNVPDAGAALGASPFFLGTGSQPLPSRVLDNGQQIEMISFGGGYSIPETSSSGPKRVLDLKIDLAFQQKPDGFDFDSYLRSVSPMSPGLKLLSSLSPINRNLSCISDQDSHMKA